MAKEDSDIDWNKKSRDAYNPNHRESDVVLALRELSRSFAALAESARKLAEF